jgi:hypothetical protein
MRKIIITEDDLKRIVKQVIEEREIINESITIDFNKLPQQGYAGGDSFNNKLHAAGWPKNITDVVSGDRKNLLRYYDEKADAESGNILYVKKLKPPVVGYLSVLPLDKRFDKYPCIKKYYPSVYTGYDNNGDSVVDVVAANQKYYYPDGTVSMSQGGTKDVKSTYYCSGDKLIDKFVKNPKGKLYSGNDPWVRETVGGKDKNGLGNYDYIPWYTKDPAGSKWISNLQKVLIDKKYLNIKAPTGFAGNMTKNATLSAAKSLMPTEETNLGNGIRRQFYDFLVGVKQPVKKNETIG